MDRSCKVAKVDACNIRNSCYKTVRKFAKKPILCCLFCGQVFESFRSKNTRVKRCCVLSPILCLINTTRKISFRKKRKPMLKKKPIQKWTPCRLLRFSVFILVSHPEFSIFNFFDFSYFQFRWHNLFYLFLDGILFDEKKAKKQKTIMHWLMQGRKIETIFRILVVFIYLTDTLPNLLSEKIIIFMFIIFMK